MSRQPVVVSEPAARRVTVSDRGKERSVQVIGIPVPGPPGPQGPAGASSAYYRHVQNTPATEWNIPHMLGIYPSVTVVDSAGTQVEGDVEYIDTNNVRVTFPSAFGGEAYCS